MGDCFNSNLSAILVHVNFFKEQDSADLQEFKTLVYSAGIECVYLMITKRTVPDPKYFIGKGKAVELANTIKVIKAAVILFNHNLTPTQERNLNKLCHTHIIDRNRLILDIFAQRAQTYEGKLQVELAQLKHLAPRLVAGWTHLERQKGGIGLRGPGEKQLETDRRLLRKRINKINLRLQSVEKQRNQSRRLRSQTHINTLSLVGYTNVGKSTLFNTICSASVYTANRFFATLDMTLRRLYIKNIGDVIVSDTIGFIRNLPCELISSFRATLTEIRHANLILHIVDAADKRINENIRIVNSILETININSIPKLLVMNKIDLLQEFNPRIDRNEDNIPTKVWVSAQTGQGIHLLVQAISEILSQNIIQQLKLVLPPTAIRLRNYFYKLKVIKEEWYEQDGSVGLYIDIARVTWKILCKQEPSLSSFLI